MHFTVLFFFFFSKFILGQMAFTRTFDDEERLQIRLQQSIEQGMYMNNVPGNGTHPFYVEDPQIRMQSWGANLMTHSIDLESELRCINRPINHDEPNHFQYTNATFRTTASQPIQYPSTRKLTTDQSRVTHPAWTYLDREQVLWSHLPLDPQENTCIPFEYNLSTRILEKDYFVAELPCFLPTNGVFPVSSPVNAQEESLQNKTK